MFDGLLAWALEQIGRPIAYVFIWFEQLVVEKLGALSLLSGIFFIGVLGGSILRPIFGFHSGGADSVSPAKRQERYNKNDSEG